MSKFYFKKNGQGYVTSATLSVPKSIASEYKDVEMDVIPCGDEILVASSEDGEIHAFETPANTIISKHKYRSIILSDILEMLANEEIEIEKIKDILDSSPTMDDFRNNLVSKFDDPDFKPYPSIDYE